MKKIKSILEYFFLIYKVFFFKIKIKYFKTNFYDKKISYNIPLQIDYKPSLHIINSLSSFSKKKIKIENFSLNSIWNLSSKKKIEFYNLHNFLWLLSLDIKTNRKSVQAIIENWIDNNSSFNKDTWNLEIISKRLVAWISNSNLTYDESNLQYKKKFITSISKQINHLLKNIESIEDENTKLICCSALILIGLVFKNKSKYFDLGLSLFKKNIKNSFDDVGFPKSRNPEELVIALKYFIIIKEWIKESQKQVPDYLEEIIFNSGKSYIFFSKNLKKLPLFNGSSELEIHEFNEYLNYLNYNFQDVSKEKYGYVIFKNKKIAFIMDIGNSPNLRHSKKYQSGCLSFEIISNNEKLVCNSGYNTNKSTIFISKSTAAHSSLYLNNHSSCTFKKSSPFKISKENKLSKGLKVLNKTITIEKEFENIVASHNGYQNRYGYIHERSIKFIKKEKIFVGIDSLIKNKNAKNVNYGIRFHIYPSIKMVKTKNSQSVLLSLKNGEGWKFSCDSKDLLIEKGIYLGNKNKILENENIYIHGVTNAKDKIIKWKFEKIS